MYSIYHIPGKKVGVTRDLNKRVTQQQGYAPGEYEVLFTGDDINQISLLEIELQKSYGYKVDTTLYKNLFKNNNQMKLNSTDQTTTFPVPLNKLKGRLMDSLGLSWVTPQGYRFTIDAQNVIWIMNNVFSSQFSNERCSIYNKAFHEFEEERFEVQTISPAYEPDEDDNIFDEIRTWAFNRGIYKSGDTKTQLIKLYEEVGELSEAVLKSDNDEFIDAIGDAVVVLTNLAELGGVRIEDCIESAYNEIANRSGDMVNGTFVKTGKLQVSDDFTVTNYLKSKSATL